MLIVGVNMDGTVIKIELLSVILFVVMVLLLMFLYMCYVHCLLFIDIDIIQIYTFFVINVYIFPANHMIIIRHHYSD